MAQKKRRRKRRLEAKYKQRRAFLLLLCIAALGFAAWRFLPLGGDTVEVDGVADEAETEPVTAAVPTERATEAQTQPETQPETEPPQPAVRTTDWNLLLVNGTTPLPEDFTVDVETVNGYRVDARIVQSITRMFNQAKEDGIDLKLISGYREVDYQRQLFENKKQEYLDMGRDEEEAEAQTVAYIARPGTSEHHTGLAVDIVTPSYESLEDDGFEDTPAFRWLDANAHRYGFILRYPKNKESITQINYEPWHYRYVGEEHAAAIKEAGYCLEEYIYVAIKEQQMLSRQEDEPADPEENGEPEE